MNDNKNYDMNKIKWPTEDEVPEKFRINAIEQQEYLVDGKIKKWDGAMYDVLSPVCIDDGKDIKQKRLGSHPMLTAEASLETLDAAVKAYDGGSGEWPSMSPNKRIEHMQELVKNMSYARDDVIKLFMWEIGKSLKDSEKEFDRTVEYIEYTIAAYKKINDDSKLQLTKGFYHQTKMQPLGVVLSMGPFNYPLNETYTTLIPALLTGNTAVFKPAKYGVLLHEPLLEAYKESFPRGVINITYGDGQTIISPLMRSGKIDTLAFIGSCRVANSILKEHPTPTDMNPPVLGLEAKNPFFIYDDADMDIALSESVSGAIGFNQQRCTAPKKFGLQRGIAGEFIKRFAEMIDNTKHGMPWDKDVNCTPLPEYNKVPNMQAYVDDALSKGAMIVNNRIYSDRTFFAPVVLADVNNTMRIYHEEQFGPVTPFFVFDDIKETVDYVKKSRYGQQASVFSQNPETIKYMTQALANQVCRININSQCQRGPDEVAFIGRKDSGMGVLSITEALYRFTKPLVTAAKDNEANKKLLDYIL